MLTPEDLPGADALSTVTHTTIRSLPLIHRGKVRDSYAVDDHHLLIVATDRLSAYDVVLPDPVPGKGAVLTALSNFWFERTADIVPNHTTSLTVADVLSDPGERAQAEGRGVVVKRLRPLPIEAVVRGYLIGSGYKDYLATGKVCGIDLPDGLKLAQKLADPLFTPATKADVGDHDVNIDFGAVCEAIGTALAEQMREAALRLYAFAVEHAAARGIIIADTKFEFGLDRRGKLVLMDEVLTPDSSRFWPASDYAVGSSPRSYDKQFVRDYLETLDWDKTAPGPRLPPDVIARTQARYREAYRVLTGPPRAS